MKTLYLLFSGGDRMAMAIGKEFLSCLCIFLLIIIINVNTIIVLIVICQKPGSSQSQSRSAQILFTNERSSMNNYYFQKYKLHLNFIPIILAVLPAAARIVCSGFVFCGSTIELKRSERTD